jgi:hypothetical protein
MFIFLGESIVDSKKYRNFAHKKCIKYGRSTIMLGINSPREPISPEFSKEIRESLRRAITGQPNEKEKAARKRLKESEKYWTMEWKGLHF